jgi:hypothetical protein
MAELPTVFMPPSLRPKPIFPELKVPTLRQMHRVTEEKLLVFLKNPFDLTGKQFVLKGERKQDDLFYEVVEFAVSKGKSHCFGVQFAGCVSAVEMESDEMRVLLQESYQIDH